ncbi:bifunctional 5,10-methylenetetrahydrofolate dehydrogenase/5,10-methenyltetrahydrofolate cyclohydrolase [Pseudonocardia sp. CA-142604]|uniref:bifunctional 5,10-methylenetetrahydrofolate dehydrogenase/5,10-methenyltetrahydrofolate cyclohydrolase n=1 Tax=Pseudonocardia sp. CA-142604 TaxID=3240024 RepID=UPI003D91B1DF
MTAEIIDGVKIAAELEEQLRRDVAALPGGRLEGALATVSAGETFQSAAYQRRLQQLAGRLDLPYEHHALPAAATEQSLLDTIAVLGNDSKVAGILLLRPLPAHIRESSVFAALPPEKDVEAVHPENAGLLALGTPRFVPSTAASAYHVLDMWLDRVGEDRARFYENATIVVVGRSNNVGKPAVSLAYQRHAAVTSIDEWSGRGSRLGFHTRRADVLIVAAGVPGLIRAEHVREGAIVLDIGINPAPGNHDSGVHIVGDVAFDGVLSRVRAITPVPGGIGPVTDVRLFQNVVLAQHNRVPGPTQQADPVKTLR